MARDAVVGAALAAVLVSVLASAATAQMDSCSGDLPAALVGNYSGMACQPVWNNFVLRVLPAGQEQRAAGGAVHHVQHGVGRDGLLAGRPHDRLQRHGRVDGQEGPPPHPPVRAPGEVRLQGRRRRQGVPRLQRPRPHRRRAAGQDLRRLPAQVLIPPLPPAHHPRVRAQHPGQEQAHQAPGQDIIHIRFHHRENVRRRGLPLRAEAGARRAQPVRVGHPDADRRHPCALLPADGPALVLPPRRHPANRLHPRPRRRRRRRSAVQQDSGGHPGAQRPRHIRACPRHPAGLGLLPQAQHGLEIPKVLELVPPLGGQAGALLCCRQHRPRDPRRRQPSVLEDRLRFQPRHPPRRRRRTRVHAVDEVVQEQHLHANLLMSSVAAGLCCSSVAMFVGTVMHAPIF